MNRMEMIVDAANANNLRFDGVRKHTDVLREIIDEADICYGVW